MTFSVVQKAISNDGNSTAGTTLTFDATVGFSPSAFTAGDTITGLCMYSNSNSAPTAVKDNASSQNTFTVKNNIFDTPNGNGVFMFEKVNITGGGTTISITWGASTSFARIEILEVSGTSTFDVSTAQLQTNVANPISSGTITPSQSGDFLYGAEAFSTGGASDVTTAGSGYTLENSGAAGPNNPMTDEVQFPYNSVTAIAATFNISQTSLSHYIGIMAFTPAATGIPDISARNMMIMP